MTRSTKKWLYLLRYSRWQWDILCFEIFIIGVELASLALHLVQAFLGTSV